MVQSDAFVIWLSRILTMVQFNGLGVNWTGTLVGAVAAAMAPIPVLFYLYGHKIRARSKFASDYVVTAQAHGKDNAG